MIGITGSIGSGKSTVCNILKQLGFVVIDCDEIVHELLDNDLDIIKAIKNEFDCVIDNKVDRKMLAKIIFNNENKRLLLNSIIHPKVIEYLNNLEDKNVFVEVPLLFEAHMESMFDKIITVFTNFDNQVKRVMDRNNISYDEAIQRINSQMDINIKIKLSDYVIDNNHDLNYTKKQINDILLKL